MFYYYCRQRGNNNKSAHYGDKPMNYYYNRKHQSQQYCLRNPVVVFCLSFLALGSLRFRVRTKQAAAHWIQRRRQHIQNRNSNNNNNNDKAVSNTDSVQSMEGVTKVERTIAYELVEEVAETDDEDHLRHHHHNPARRPTKIQRYRAIWVDVSVHTQPQKQSSSSSSSSSSSFNKGRRFSRFRRNAQPRPVSVFEWTQHMLQQPPPTQAQPQPKNVATASSKTGTTTTTTTITTATTTTNPLLDQFIQILASGNDYPAYFLETKAVTANNAKLKPFEFVLVEAPQLEAFVMQQQQQQESLSSKSSSSSSSRSPSSLSSLPFQDNFLTCRKEYPLSSACVFRNLSGDAILVAPMPQARQTASLLLTSIYGHLANFVRQAPYAEVYHFWEIVLQTYLDRLTMLPSASMTDSNGGGAAAAAAGGDGDDNKNDQAAPASSSVSAVVASLKKQRHLKERQGSTTNNQGGGGNDNVAKRYLFSPDEPVWMSTSGMGIAWLHVRLDQRPKYYTYQPFAKEQ